jgi:hypothetical protein
MSFSCYPLVYKGYCFVTVNHQALAVSQPVALAAVALASAAVAAVALASVDVEASAAGTTKQPTYLFLIPDRRLCG